MFDRVLNTPLNLSILQIYSQEVRKVKVKTKTLSSKTNCKLTVNCLRQKRLDCKLKIEI